jgi:hypothetical protein
MVRTLLVATLLFACSNAAWGQEPSVLHIKAVVVDPAGMATPVPRHALLISEDPPTTAPRRVFTALDGTANVRLRPGDYTIESDQPLVFYGKAYQWTRHVTIVAGRDATLELTAGNAEIETATAPPSAAAPPEVDPSLLQLQWQDSIFAIWTPTAHGSGFLIDAKGLIATNQRAVGSATSVEVQLSPAVKVMAKVLVADAMRDVAVLWIDPGVVASVRPLPLECSSPKPPAAADQELFTIGVPLRGTKRMTSGVADVRVPSGSAGGPVFTERGVIVGITSIVDGSDGADSRIVRIDAACEVLAPAEAKLKGTSPPAATRLPIEPARPVPLAALKDVVQRRAGSLNPTQISSSDFDIAFLTPVHVYGAQSRADQQREPAVARPLFDFGNWSEYVADVPPVLLIRVTPKMVEGFLTTLGRVAARTQGVELPPIKHVKTGFLRMRVFCGDAEVTPIHPFTIEQRISEREAIDEGLYVFDPAALGPHCAAVTLELFSEKEPQEGDTRVVDPRIVQGIWQDFALYRQ